MLKRIYIMALVLASATAIFASPIDKQSALSAAKAFLASKGSTAQLIENKPIRAAKGMGASADEAYYYIFNATDNGGFVIVAGDDNVTPVLGYADSGHIDLDDMPDGLKVMLECYKETIDQLPNVEPEAALQSTPTNARRSMSRAKYPVKPFLTKFWGHKAPFNELNPILNDTVCPAGCANVSIAEVMAYYEYPTGCNAIAGYTTNTHKLKIETLPAINFDWQNMLSDYTIEIYDSVQAAAAATLIRYIGQALKSDYQTTTTPSIANNIVPLFKTFGYTTSAFTMMSAKTDNEWEEIFYENLFNKQPVVICASNVIPNGSGHTFILDGYDQDGYYHIDWGWTGNANGYFRITNFSPYQNTNSYTYMRNMNVIYDIVPSTITNNATAFASAQDACLTTTAIKVENANDISVTRKNTTGAARTFKQGIGLVGASNQLVKVLEWDTLTYKSNASATVKWNALDLSGIDDGTYRIYPISQVDDEDDTWHFDICKSTNAYVEITTNRGSYNLAAKKAVVYNSFTTDTSLPNIKGAARVYKLNITNNTLDLFQKRLYLYEDSMPTDFQVARIQLNSTGDVEFVYCPGEVGKHTLRLCSDTLKNATSEVLFTQEVEVEKEVSYKLRVADYEVANYDKENARLYGNSLRIKYTIKNSGSDDYDDFVRFLLKHGSWYNTKKVLVHIPAGETQDFEYECDNLVYGESYPMLVSFKSASATDPNILDTNISNITFKPRPAICTWDNDGKLHAEIPSKAAFTMPEDAVALDLTGLTTVPASITPNSNPNTLYSVTKKYSTLDGLNQIVAGKAQCITLVDGYSFLSPFEFHTDTIVYTRTFEKGFTGRRNGNNWSTIVLPFNVEKVFNTVDSVEVDWFKPSDSTDKNFWVRKFYGEDGGYTYFENTEEMEAYVPYIVTVPSDYKGEDYCLVGKPLEFSATDAKITPGKVVMDANNHNFQGSFTETATYGDYVYFLDEEDNGNSFVYVKGETTVKPFRAYFTSETAPEEGSRLLIHSHITLDQTNGIQEMGTAQKGCLPGGVYHISGQRVRSAACATVEETLQGLPAGIYVIDGKKYKK